MSGADTPGEGTALDLADLDLQRAADGGFDVQIEHPTLGPLPFWIRVVGRDSTAYLAKARALSAARNQRLAKRGRGGIPTPEELEAETVELLVVATVGWRVAAGFRWKKEPFPAFTPAFARTLYADDGHAYIREQVDRAIADRANFSPASATS